QAVCAEAVAHLAHHARFLRRRRGLVRDRRTGCPDAGGLRDHRRRMARDLAGGLVARRRPPSLSGPPCRRRAAAPDRWFAARGNEAGLRKKVEGARLPPPGLRASFLRWLRSDPPTRRMPNMSLPSGGLRWRRRTTS